MRVFLPRWCSCTDFTDIVASSSLVQFPQSSLLGDASRPPFENDAGIRHPSRPGSRRWPVGPRWRWPALRWHAPCTALARHACFHRCAGRHHESMQALHVRFAKRQVRMCQYRDVLRLNGKFIPGSPFSFSDGVPGLQKHKCIVVVPPPASSVDCMQRGGASETHPVGAHRLVTPIRTMDNTTSTPMLMPPSRSADNCSDKGVPLFTAVVIDPLPHADVERVHNTHDELQAQHGPARFSVIDSGTPRTNCRVLTRHVSPVSMRGGGASHASIFPSTTTSRPKHTTRTLIHDNDRRHDMSTCGSRPCHSAPVVTTVSLPRGVPLIVARCRPSCGPTAITTGSPLRCQLPLLAASYSAL
jgi:hypothetical protein